MEEMKRKELQRKEEIARREQSSRNKKSLALDLNTSKGQEILKELIKEADVFVRTVASEQSEDVHNSSFDIVTWYFEGVEISSAENEKLEKNIKIIQLEIISNLFKYIF